MIALPFLSIRSRNRFWTGPVRDGDIGYPSIGCAPVERLAARAPGLDRGRNSDFGRLGRLIVALAVSWKAMKVGHGSPFGFLGCATMPAPSITPRRVIWPWTITAT